MCSKTLDQHCLIIYKCRLPQNLLQLVLLVRNSPLGSLLLTDTTEADVTRALKEKMAQLAMPDQVYNWIRDFFYERYHCAKFAGDVFSLVDITASVVQGSSLGPASYIVT